MESSLYWTPFCILQKLLLLENFISHFRSILSLKERGMSRSIKLMALILRALPLFKLIYIFSNECKLPKNLHTF